MELKGKSIVITGVSRGIGRELVRLYLAKGCIVCGLGRTRPDFSNPNFHFYQTDIRKRSEINEAMHLFLEVTDGHLDVVVNNAGVGFFGLLEDYDDDSIATMFETNVYGLIYLNQLVAPILKKQGKGHIFNISSIAGLDAFPQVSVYCATKHAVKAISESMYKEMRDFGVKVTCVYPGSVKTDFFKNIDSVQANDNMLMPEDVASMIVHASETPDNFHQVNLEIRPLQPKGKSK